jgi:hypothetical protein
VKAMTQYIDQKIFSQVDRGGLQVYGHLFRNCQFVNCAFSLTDKIESRSYARDIHIFDCHIANAQFGPGVIEDVDVDGLLTDDTTAFFGTLFRRVRLRGEIGKISICPEAASWSLPNEVQVRFDSERAAFYAKTDWALDISKAHFEELDIVGIPASLIRRNPDRQFVITREGASREDWRHRVSANCDYWTRVIDQFLQDNDQSTVLVAPKTSNNEKQQRLADGLQELRALGILT